MDQRQVEHCCFPLKNPKRRTLQIGDKERDILEDLSPADVRVLLQAEEELGQVGFIRKYIIIATSPLSSDHLYQIVL